MREHVDASQVVVAFKDEHGNVSHVSVSTLLNELFTVVFQLEERLNKLEPEKTEKKDSRIITLGDS